MSYYNVGVALALEKFGSSFSRFMFSPERSMLLARFGAGTGLGAGAGALQAHFTDQPMLPNVIQSGLMTGLAVAASPRIVEMIGKYAPAGSALREYAKARLGYREMLQILPRLESIAKAFPESYGAQRAIPAAKQQLENIKQYFRTIT